MIEAQADGARSDDLVLAVDGGGVKTDLALLEPSGNLLALVRGRGSHIHYLDIDLSISDRSTQHLVVDGRLLCVEDRRAGLHRSRVHQKCVSAGQSRSVRRPLG